MIPSEFYLGKKTSTAPTSVEMPSEPDIPDKAKEDRSLPVDLGKPLCVLFVTKDGIIEDYLPSSVSYVQEMLGENAEDAIRIYDNKPAFMVRSNNTMDEISPFFAPSSDDIVTTSPRLYGIAVGIPKEVAELERIDNEEADKNRNFDKLLGYVVAFVVITVALVMLVAIVFGNNTVASSSNSSQSNSNVPAPNFSLPTPSAAQPITPEAK